ncbi:holliday junction resolvase [Mycobacterium phage AlleyCat]|uniref:Holliday junction resolvase n=4 Tax=Kratiovirus larva TaxID=1056831 RepID=A0A221J779_9CAUD|nr:RusA-like Holliday junction resolvase [Mycobacterium phage Larva]AEL19714.1 holliday junction resolvase [Mycobacterium phage Larva]ASM62573.1 holliday junction resolvase [Mycobacterium phage AlleyCat]QQV92668.1 RusA-like resolvase [Mycobacterium phage Psycho]WAB09748.1 RusA-like resolvase [Mycobacterium phage Dadosky]
MGRSMRSAKAAGAKFERDVADYLAARVDDRIDRRVKTGAKDRGDIGGVRLHGQRVVLECKNVATMSLPQWTREAQIEAGNDDALVGVVVHKRHGTGDVGKQWVSMTLDDLVAILTGVKVAP